MKNYSKTDISALINRVFFKLDPISDSDLYSSGFSPVSEENVLKNFRKKNRFDVFLSGEKWVDSDVLYQMTGYAKWYFSPTFMLIILNNVGSYSFEHLVHVFSYSYGILDDIGVDSCNEEVSDDELRIAIANNIDMRSCIGRLKVENCLPESEIGGGCLDFNNFAVSASYFSPIEKKVVSIFLHWLLKQWPNDIGIRAALISFWDA